MSNYSDAELKEVRLIDKLVCEALQRLGLSGSNRSIDELIASGEFKAAECLVRSKDMVTPGWLERARSDSENKS